MMTHAYQEIYLSNAQSAMGDAFDYTINTCKIPGENFIQMLLSSSVCKKLENGEPAVKGSGLYRGGSDGAVIHFFRWSL